MPELLVMTKLRWNNVLFNSKLHVGSNKAVVLELSRGALAFQKLLTGVPGKRRLWSKKLGKSVKTLFLLLPPLEIHPVHTSNMAPEHSECSEKFCRKETGLNV